MKKKHIYAFSDGDGQDKKLLGGKGANLCEMTQIGINVPPGFVITTEACLDYLQENALPDGLMASVKDEIGKLEAQTGRTFGSGPDPLLVSVRSGSAMSMPGMMDTILNLGLNDETLTNASHTMPIAVSFNFSAKSRLVLTMKSSMSTSTRSRNRQASKRMLRCRLSTSKKSAKNFLL